MYSYINSYTSFSSELSAIDVTGTVYLQDLHRLLVHFIRDSNTNILP
jgi:hypothetical protein